MADIHGSPGDPGLQMPQNAASAGPAPVPYAGGDQKPEPPVYHADIGPLADAAAAVMAGVTGLNTTQAAGAHDISSADLGISATPDAPYYPGTVSAINAAGDNDAGGRDDVAASVAQAVSNATGRWQEFQSDTYPQGSTYGDLMQFPPSGQDPGAGVGNTLPTQGFYDPPREYGGAAGAPDYGGNTGNQPPPGYQGEAQ